MYSLSSLGIRITPKGVDELLLAAIEMRKTTKSTQTTKQDYQWRQQSLKILKETVAVTDAQKIRGNLKEKRQSNTKTDKKGSYRFLNHADRWIEVNIGT